MPYECDWRDADACAYLHDLGATAFAWEFLRRNSAYQAAYQSIAGAGHAVAEMSERVAHQWGCDFAADPSLSADRASVVWLPHINPTTVVLGPAPDESVEARSISEVTLPLSRLTANGEHWLLDRGCDALPIALIGGMDTARRVAVVIPLDDSFPVRAEAAGRLFNALTARTPARAPSALTEQQRRRLGLVLRGLDGWLERCSYRQGGVANVVGIFRRSLRYDEVI